VQFRSCDVDLHHAYWKCTQASNFFRIRTWLAQGSARNAKAAQTNVPVGNQRAGLNLVAAGKRVTGTHECRKRRQKRSHAEDAGVGI